jgi:predicted DNA-binding transcriptional regulator AlpA
MSDPVPALLAEILAELRGQRVAIGHRLWSADDVADYLRVDRRYVLERLAPRTDWPRPVKLSDGIKAPVRWKAAEVILWAEKRRRAA